MAIGSNPIAGAAIAADGSELGIPHIDLTSAFATTSEQKILPYMFNPASTLGAASVLPTFGMGHAHNSSLSAASSITFELANHFISEMGAASTLDTQLAGNVSLSSAIGMSDAAVITHVLQLMSNMGFNGTLSIEHLKVLAFLSSIGAQSSTDNNVQFAVNVASALVMKSFASYGWEFDVVSAAALASAFETRYNAVYNAISSMQLASTADFDRQLGMAFISNAEFASTYDTQANLHIDLFDALVGQAVFKIGDDVYQGWVFSVEHGAFTEYSNYPFNSIVELGGKPYGVADDGIYLLEGDDDAGTQIDAAVRTKLSSFRQRVLKRARAAYIGYTSTGKMVLKVVVEREGELHEHWYQEKLGATKGMRTGRVPIQKGLKSTYWQFELANQNGADFDIEDVTIEYEVLSRRIK